MNTERTKNIIQPDYKTIRELSHRIDCTITQSDFNTNHPNLNRISYTASDINRYLKHKEGKFNGFEYR